MFAGGNCYFLLVKTEKNTTKHQKNSKYCKKRCSMFFSTENVWSTAQKEAEERVEEEEDWGDFEWTGCGPVELSGRC